MVVSCVLTVMAVNGGVEECIRAEYDRLVGAVAVVCESFALAEEAVQEAFARAWERQQRGYHFDHLAGWVATVALNLARSGRRRRKVEDGALRTLARRPAPPREDPHAVDDVVRSAVDGLPRRQRDVVCLYYFLDLDVATVAQLLGVSDGTVKTALSRARARLAVELVEQELEA